MRWTLKNNVYLFVDPPPPPAFILLIGSNSHAIYLKDVLHALFRILQLLIFKLIIAYLSKFGYVLF